MIEGRRASAALAQVGRGAVIEGRRAGRVMRDARDRTADAVDDTIGFVQRHPRAVMNAGYATALSMYASGLSGGGTADTVAAGIAAAGALRDAAQ